MASYLRPEEDSDDFYIMSKDDESSSSSEDDYDLVDFAAVYDEHLVSMPASIPKELNIFYRDISSFLPEGKVYEDLTPEEDFELRQKYRFDPLRPGIYQGITGYGFVVGEFTRKYNQYPMPSFDEDENDEFWSSSSSSSSSSSE